MPARPTPVTECQTCGGWALATPARVVRHGEHWAVAWCPRCRASIPYRLGPAALLQLTLPGPLVRTCYDHERRRLLAAWRESGPGDGPDAVPSGTWVLEVTSGRVVALDIPTGMVGQPLAAGEGLAVGVDAGGGALVAFDSGDGTMRWTRPPAGPPPARAVIAAGMVGLDPVGLPPDAPFEVLEADRGTPARPVHRGAFPPAWAAAIRRRTEPDPRRREIVVEGTDRFDRWAAMVSAATTHRARWKLHVLGHGGWTVIDGLFETPGSGAGGWTERVLVVGPAGLRWDLPVHLPPATVELVGSGLDPRGAWLEGASAVVQRSPRELAVVPLSEPPR
ncbi:MAG: hypothetical protein R2749_05075 [Acidimicrobiales bacterium]